MHFPKYSQILIIILSGFALTFARRSATRFSNGVNDSPIIGIVSQMYNVSSNETYIAASYVKFVEAGGARVVPIRLGRQNTTYPDTLNRINGVLFPGGNVSATDSRYANVAKYIYQYAIDANNKGDYFPIWAIDLGFEMLANFLAPNHNLMTACSAEQVALPLNISDGATGGKLFTDLPVDVYQSLLNEQVTANDHQKCLTPQNVSDSGLDQAIQILSTNTDANGLEFVSTYEALRYPFYGLQWHPEKAPWEWTTIKANIPHIPSAVRVTQYFASFLANEARKSAHKYEDRSREESDLIYNIKPSYTGKNGSSEYEQIYTFKTG